MTIAAILLAYAIGIGTLGARMLARADWTARAPLLAILIYLAAVWSVVASRPSARCSWITPSRLPTASRDDTPP